MKNKESPEEIRERMRQEELRGNPSSSIHGSNLTDLFGGLSWKSGGILILLLIIMGVYFLLKSNPPLETGMVAISENNKSVVIGIGNNGFSEMQILDISVNNDEKPFTAKLQVSNALQGFVLTDDYKSEEAKKYRFINVGEVVIKPGGLSYDEVLSKDDEIYGVSVIHEQEIFNVHIEYKHFGMTFTKTLYVSN